MNQSSRNSPNARLINLFKSVLHNIGVLIVGLIVAFVGTRIDLLLGISGFNSPLSTAAAWVLLAIGFLLRVWATFHFYEHQMVVISLTPQNSLITGGPCENPYCGVSEAPQWRRIEKRLVCNRCGMYHHRHGRFPDAAYFVSRPGLSRHCAFVLVSTQLVCTSSGCKSRSDRNNANPSQQSTGVLCAVAKGFLSK